VKLRLTFGDCVALAFFALGTLLGCFAQAECALSAATASSTASVDVRIAR
jgi:hypothetical protein